MVKSPAQMASAAALLVPWNSSHLLDSFSEEEEKVVIDVESVMLGPLDKPVHVKAEPRDEID